MLLRLISTSRAFCIAAASSDDQNTHQGPKNSESVGHVGERAVKLWGRPFACVLVPAGLKLRHGLFTLMGRMEAAAFSTGDHFQDGGRLACNSEKNMKPDTLKNIQSIKGPSLVVLPCGCRAVSDCVASLTSNSRSGT